MATYTGTDMDPRIERTRTVVLDAAAAIVAEAGYDNTTIEGVSERCGVARSTIYRHWPGKAELVVDAIKSRLVAGAEIDTGSVRTDAIAFVNELVGWFFSKEGMMIALSLLTAAHRDPALGKLHSDATRARRTHLIEIVEKGIKRGELPAELVLEEAANDLIGPFFYKKIILHEDIDSDYVENRVDCWLTHLGWTEQPVG